MRVPADSLAARFAELQAERAATWPPERLAANAAQRRAAVAGFDARRAVAAGDRVAPFTLEAADGTPVSLDLLTARGPVVVLFFRFAGCPACNVALPHYDRHLGPGIAAAGATMIGVSPHLPETGLGAIAARHGLRFPIAADRGLALARRLGLSFDRGVLPDGQPTPGWVGELTGTGSAELPYPAVVVIDPDRTVRFADTTPDWMARTEAAPVLAALSTPVVRAAA